MPKFIMMMGVPGCGKSTHAKYLKAIDSSYEIISRDAIVMLAGSQWKGGSVDYATAFANVDHKHVDRVLNEQYSSALKEGKNIIHDMTNLTKAARRRRLSQVGKKYIKEIIYFPISDVLMFQRADHREAEGKIIPHNVLSEMFKSIEPPLYEEGFNHIVIKDQVE